MIRRLSRGQRTDEAPSTEEEPLFNLDEIYERRILSWSPEPEDDAAPSPEPTVEADDDPVARELPAEPSAAEARSVAVARPPETTIGAPTPVENDGAAPQPSAAEPARGAADASAASPTALGVQPTRRRGRPRGRPRRQVHFHVDPDEERLLIKAVEVYGSQQKALVAALEALEQTELLREEIDELRQESARQRELLAKAESLFSRG